MSAWNARELRVYAADWLARRSPDLRPRSVALYRHTIDRHIVPHIGELYLTQVTRRLVRDLLTALRQQGLAPNTVRLVRAVLSAVCQDAVEREQLPFNPVTGLRVSGQRVRERRVLDRHELDHFLATAHVIRPWRYACLATAAFTGLRIGEAVGLQRLDVSLPGRFLRVVRSVLPLGQVMPTPKSKRPRTVVLPERLVPILEPVVLAADLWLFPGRAGPLRYRTVQQDIAAVAAAAGIPRVTAHALRRSYASILAAEGVDLLVLRDQLGHASVKQTEQYIGLLPASDAVRAPLRMF